MHLIVRRYGSMNLLFNCLETCGTFPKHASLGSEDPDPISSFEKRTFGNLVDTARANNASQIRLI